MGSTMTTTLPWELIIDVLTRLGAHDLLRLRAVCKSWRSLVDGPHFVKLHLTRSSRAGRLVVFGGGCGDLLWIDPRHLLESPRRISCPIDTRTGLEVIGSCNGLVAIANRTPITHLAIWNPFTRKHVVLPKQKNLLSSLLPSGAVIRYSITGFGYDPISDDYKLVSLIEYRNSFVDPVFHVAEVYSLRAKAWKRVNDFPAHLRYGAFTSGVLVRNALHWFMTHRSDHAACILAFDLASEDSSVLRPPVLPVLMGFHSHIVKMMELGGQICMASVAELNSLGRAERVDMWVMQEYGVRESWTRLFSVGPSSPTDFFGLALPVMYLEKSEGENSGGGGGGDRILMNWNCDIFAVYDLKKKKRVEQMKVPGIQRIFGSLVYVPSLVGVGGDDSESASKEGGEKPKPKSGGNKKSFSEFEQG